MYGLLGKRAARVTVCISDAALCSKSL